jgi:hypothetical protein
VHEAHHRDMQDSATTAIQADYPLGGMNIDVFFVCAEHVRENAS